MQQKFKKVGILILLLIGLCSATESLQQLGNLTGNLPSTFTYKDCYRFNNEVNLDLKKLKFDFTEKPRVETESSIVITIVPKQSGVYKGFYMSAYSKDANQLLFEYSNKFDTPFEYQSQVKSEITSWVPTE